MLVGTYALALASMGRRYRQKSWTSRGHRSSYAFLHTNYAVMIYFPHLIFINNICERYLAAKHSHYQSPQPYVDPFYTILHMSCAAIDLLQFTSLPAPLLTGRPNFASSTVIRPGR